jgi:hypothetical protein
MATTTDLTVIQVLNKSASLMNDTARSVYTYGVQLPYLNIAFDELQEAFELNNIPVTNQTTSAIITVAVGITQINPTAGLAPITAPNYPEDLVEIQGLYERLSGSTDPFVPMHQREFLPHALDDIPTSDLQYWIWQDQRIKFIGALTPREVKIDYIKALFQTDLGTSSVIGVINARSFLYYRTAALCSQFIGNNKSRADELNAFAGLALDRVTGIGVKGKQAIQTRRRPFMGAYKRRSFT